MTFKVELRKKQATVIIMGLYSSFIVTVVLFSDGTR